MTGRYVADRVLHDRAQLTTQVEAAFDPMSPTLHGSPTSDWSASGAGGVRSSPRADPAELLLILSRTLDRLVHVDFSLSA